MKRVLPLLLLLSCVGAAKGEQASAVRPDDPRRGWHFYDDAAKSPPARLIPKVDAAPPEIGRYQALQRAVEEARIVAVMSPTLANVRAYLELESHVLHDASRFADVAQRVAWMSPELDPSAQARPSATFAVDVFERQQVAERQARIAALGRDHIVLFFFRGDCPYCHAFAPVLKAFEQRYGLQVTAISTDGGALPDFPRPRDDGGISQTLNVKQVPALFLAHPASGRIAPLGFGVLSENELVERIVTTAAAEQSDAARTALSR